METRNEVDGKKSGHIHVELLTLYGEPSLNPGIPDMCKGPGLPSLRASTGGWRRQKHPGRWGPVGAAGVFLCCIPGLELQI